MDHRATQKNRVPCYTFDRVSTVLTAHQENRDLLRFHYHRLDEMLSNLRDLDLPRQAFSSELTEIPAIKQFISIDEINDAMAGGSGFSGGKGRIFDYFQQPHTSKEKVNFLKAEYGIGGHSHALSGAIGSDEWHDGKGVRYKKTRLSRCEIDLGQSSCHHY